jgi:predicted regulator of Ras-like GTPase activity (Roadblock/LC7/MglB family)
MDDIREKLEKLERVDGFIAAGAIDSKGSLVAQFSTIKRVRWNDICDITSDVFNKTQSLTDVTGIGETRFVHIKMPEGNILAQCLDKMSDDSAAKIDRIFIFLSPKGNTALGKMNLQSIGKEIA